MAIIPCEQEATREASASNAQTKEKTFLKLAHSAPILGRKQTLEKLSQHFYWPGMCQEAKEFVRQCTECQKVTPLSKARAPQAVEKSTKDCFCVNPSHGKRCQVSCSYIHYSQDICFSFCQRQRSSHNAIEWSGDHWQRHYWVFWPP